MDEFELFIKAVKRGSVESFDKYFKSDYLNRKDNQLWCPIHYACKRSYKEIIEKLISLNCDINECGGRSKWCPIQIACLEGRADVVSLLTLAECDIECKNARSSPMTIAKKYHNNEILDILTKRKFLLACKKGDSEAVRSMLKATNIEYCDKDNRRPIHWASDMNHIDIVKLLLEQNCNLDEKDKSNFSPLDIARKNKNEELIKIFEEEISERPLKEMISKMGVKCTDQCDHKQLCPKLIKDKLLEGGENIGNGTFGCVTKFKGSGTDNMFAVKTLRVKKSTEHCIEANLYKFKHLLNHERIIKYFGSVTRGENRYIIMEYAVKGSLEDKRKDMKTDDVIRFTRQILEGLKHLHDNNIIHRDLKPGNILLDDEDNVKLADFGDSRILSKGPPGNLATMSIQGTDFFMAPEVRLDRHYGTPVDIWSLGATIIYLLDDSVSPDETTKLGTDEIFQLPKLKRITKRMKEFINNMLCKTPEKRHTADVLLKSEIFHNST